MLSTHLTYPQEEAGGKIAIVVHGGAGVILRENLTPEMESQYRAKLTEAILAGYAALKERRSGLDAVEATIRILEDSPLFNAGKGAVFTHDGTNELDASIMAGNTLLAGAVAGVKHIKNPISVARLVMERSPHVMLIGTGAEAFAKREGVELVDEKYFYTEKRWQQLQEALAKEKEDSSKGRKMNAIPLQGSDGRYGTVGCVVLDAFGNLAAGTSTGGMTNKRAGRVGDAPIIGAGTYANNATCAVSATGDGEYFIREGVSRDISAMMEYKGLSVDSAAAQAIAKVGKLGGTGGVIALDRHGNMAMPFNSPGMYRAYIDAGGKVVVKIFRE
jgi:beta-aspartyl-peptidase (threonine type)